MTKTLTAIAVAAALGLASIAVPQHAEARGGRIAAGIIGGVLAGGLIGAAVAHGPYYYGPPGYYYGPGPVYYGPRCWWQRERFWDGYGWRIQRVRVCD